jgi:hypothetical protein
MFAPSPETAAAPDSPVTITPPPPDAERSVFHYILSCGSQDTVHIVNIPFHFIYVGQVPYQYKHDTAPYAVQVK